jgi:hypothetical protein
MKRREQGVIAYDKDGWIGIGNPYARTMTLYRVPPNLHVENSNQVELIATRFFGRVKAIRPIEPPKPKKPSFS